VAKLIVDMSDDLKEVIQKYADKNKMSIKQVTMKALGLLIKELNKKS
jgi:hypothetical protein